VIELGDEARRSPWVGEVPGLARAVSGWEHELAGHRTRLHGRARHVARPGLLSPGRVVRQSAAMTAAQLGWVLRRLPDDIGSGRPFAQTGEWAQDTAGYLLREQLANLGPAAAELARVLTDSEGIVPGFLVSELRQRPLPSAPLGSDLAARIVQRSLPVGVGPLGGMVASTAVSELHEGELDDGTPVLVRVARPGAGREVRQDARIAATVLAPFETLVPVLAAVRPLGLVELVSRQLAEASDMRNEALNAVELGLVIERLGIEVSVCRPVPGLVSAAAAVFEAPPGGFPLYGAGPGVDTRPLARLVVEAALAAGTFAADLRLDQVAVRPDGRLMLTGCGAVGHLDLTTRRAALDLLPALVGGDLAGQAAAWWDLGIADDGAAAEALVAALADIQPANPLLLLSGQGAGVGALGRDLLAVLLRHGATPPLELVQLARAVLALRAIFRRTEAPGGLMAALFPLLARVYELRTALD
jgi:ubiquinone biosynthesis protein